MRLLKLFRKYTGLYKLDKILEKYVDFDNGYFVELGANDGITQSNTFYFEKYRGWSGVLVEPILHNYLKCKKNRPSSHVFCNACTSFSFTEKFVEIAFSNLMSTPVNLETDINDTLCHAKSGEQFLMPGEEVTTIGAIASTLNSILIRSNSPKLIDLLSLDVEGAEIEVLKGIDHNTYKFKFICVESRSPLVIEEFLSENGYKLINKLSVHDYLFKYKTID